MDDDDEEGLDIDYVGIDRDTVLALERLLEGDDGGAKGRAHLRPGCERHQGVTNLRRMSAGSLGSLMRVWQQQQEEVAIKAREAMLAQQRASPRRKAGGAAGGSGSGSGASPTKGSKTSAKSRRAAQRKQKQKQQKRDETGSTQEDTSDDAAGAGAGGGGGVGGGGGAGGGAGAGAAGGAGGDDQDASNKPQQRRAKPSPAFQGYDQHDYLKCHGSLAAKFHGRLMVGSELPRLRTQLKRDMHATSAALKEHFESMDPNNALLFLTQGTPGPLRPTPKVDPTTSFTTPFKQITQRTVTAEEAARTKSPRRRRQQEEHAFSLTRHMSASSSFAGGEASQWTASGST